MRLLLTPAFAGAAALMTCTAPSTFAAAQQAPETVELIPGKTCAPVAIIQASLRAEGQVKIVEGFGDIPGRPRELLPREIFTSNVSRTLGYNVSFGTAATGDEGTACVGAKYTDIRLNSNPDFARPSWAYIAPSNSSYNRFLSTQETRVNAKVIMGATALTRGADGQERRGELLIVYRGNGDQYVSNQGALVAASTSDGRYLIAVDLVDIEPNATNFFELARLQDAELAPRP